MNLDSLYSKADHEAGAWVTIKDQSGVDTDLEILVKGLDSDAFRKARDKALKRFLDRSKEEADANADIEGLLEVVIDWRGATVNDEPFEFNKTKCRELFLNAPYIFEQVNNFVGDRKNFIKG